MRAKTIILSAVFAAMSLGAFAQGATENVKQLNFGLLYGSYEQSIASDFTVKGELSIGNYAYNSGVTVDATANYYWDRLIGLPANWDLYSGLGVAFATNRYNNIYVAFETKARWHFSDKWGLDFGYSNTNWGLGLTMQL